MTNLAVLEHIVNSPTVVRMLAVAETAISSLAQSYVRLLDGFSDADMRDFPAELRTIVPLRVHKAAIRCEITILSVTVLSANDYAADVALKFVDAENNYNITLDDRDRLLNGLNHIYDGLLILDVEGRKDELCISLPRLELD